MGHDWTTALGTTPAAKRHPSWIRATGINKLVTIGGQLTPLESGQHIMGHFILGKYGHERSGHLLELVQLVLIIGGSLLDNWEAAVLHSKNWVRLPLLFDQKIFLILTLFTQCRHNTKPANSTQIPACTCFTLGFKSCSGWKTVFSEEIKRSHYYESLEYYISVSIWFDLGGRVLKISTNILSLFSLYCTA